MVHCRRHIRRERHLGRPAVGKDIGRPLHTFGQQPSRAPSGHANKSAPAAHSMCSRFSSHSVSDHSRTLHQASVRFPPDSVRASPSAVVRAGTAAAREQRLPIALQVLHPQFEASSHYSCPCSLNLRRQRAGSSFSAGSSRSLLA